MNLKDKRDNLLELKQKRNNLIKKKNDVLNKKISSFGILCHSFMSILVFCVSYKSFVNISPLLIFFSTFGYICFVPAWYYHKNKLKAKIIDVDIESLNSNIENLSNYIRKEEIKNLEEMLSEENQRKFREGMEEANRYKTMPLFIKENIVENISSEDIGIKLTLKK